MDFLLIGVDEGSHGATRPVRGQVFRTFKERTPTSPAPLQLD